MPDRHQSVAWLLTLGQTPQTDTWPLGDVVCLSGTLINRGSGIYAEVAHENFVGNCPRGTKQDPDGRKVKQSVAKWSQI